MGLMPPTAAADSVVQILQRGISQIAARG